ncbi:MAG: hypothetical protein AAFX56_11985 [Pseudomonadota bacterium]
MLKRKLVLALCIVGTVAAISGCSSIPSPTHTWEAPVTEPRYHADNRSCSPGNKPRQQFVSSSGDFVAYKDCMQLLGYQFVALR